MGALGIARGFIDNAERTEILVSAQAENSAPRQAGSLCYIALRRVGRFLNGILTGCPRTCRK